MTSSAQNEYVYLGGKSRRYLNTSTGQTISRRQYDKRFRLGPRGISSYEALAKRRAHAGYAPLARTKDRVDAAVERVYRTGMSPTQAARVEHMSPETLRRYNRDRGILRYNQQSRRGEVHAAGRESFFDAAGTLHHSIPFDQREIRTMSAYGNAVQDAKKGRVRWARSHSRMSASMMSSAMSISLLTDINAYLRLEQIHDDIDPLDFFQSGDALALAPMPVAA